MADHRLEIVLSARDITEKAFGQFQNRVKAITNQIFSFQGAIATLAGTGGIGYLVKSSIDTADAIGKTADKLGIGTKALQEYRFAADQNGVAQNTLDMALQRFTRRAAEAYQGTGELKGILNQYGIEVEDVSGKMRSSEDIFADLADLIQSTGSRSERLRIAFKAFDSEGAALVNMLSDGSAGLEKYKEEAEALGIVIDERLIRDAERAGEKLDVLGKIVRSNVTSAILTLAPEISDVATRMADWTKANKVLIDQKIETYTGNIKEAVSSVSGFLKQTKEGWDSLPSIIKEVGIVGALVGGTKAKLGLIVLVEAMGYMKKIDDQVKEAAADQGRLVRAQITQQEQLIARLKNNLEEMKGDAHWEAEYTKRIENAESVLTRLKNKLDEIKVNSKAAAEGMDKAAESIAAANRKVAESLEETKKPLYDARAALIDLKDVDLSGIVSDFTNINEIAMDTFRSHGEDFSAYFRQEYKQLWGVDYVEAVRDGTDEATEAHKKYLQEQEDRQRKFLDNMQDATAMSLRSVFDGNIKTMADGSDLMVDYFKSGLSELSSAALLEGESIVGSFREIFSAVSTTISSIMSTNPYLLLIAGIVAGGYALGESLNGGEAKDTWKYATGAGTVLGNADLESESLSRSLEILNDTNADSFSELQGIRSEMIELNSNISGLVLNVLHGSTGYNAADLGIDVGKFYDTSNMEQFWNMDLFSRFTTEVMLQAGGMFENLAKWAFGGGKKRELLSTGIQTGGISIDDLLAGADVETTGFERHRTTKSGMFGSSSSKIYTSIFDLEESVTSMFTRVFENIGDTMVEISKGLGTDNLEEVMSYVFDVSKIDLKDLTGEEITEKISAWISAEGDTAVEALFGEVVSKYQRLDEGLLETAARLVSDKEGVLAALEKTNQSFTGTGREAIDFSQTIVGLAGSLDTLSTSTRSYYDSFFSENEKFTDLGRTLSDSLEALDQTLPTSKNGFRGLVEGLDLTTDAGRELYVALMSLSESAGEYYDTLENRERSRNQLLIEQYNLEGRTAEATALIRQMRLEELAAMDETLVSIQGRIYALEDENATAAAARAIADERAGLERQLLELQGDTAAIRALERNALDEGNRELYDRINALRDEQAASAAAAEASRELAAQMVSIEAVQMKGKGFTSDEIRLAQIADRYGWEGQYRIGGEYDWAGIQANLEAFSEQDPEKAQRGLTNISERTGATVSDVISDIDFVWDMIRDETVSATEEIESSFDDVSKSANDAVERAISAQIDMLSESENAIRSVFDLLKNEVRSLYEESSTALTVAAGKAFINQALAVAMSTGVLPGKDELSEAIGAARRGLDTANYGSAFELERDRLLLAGKLSRLQEISGDQLSVVEKQIAALESIDAGVGDVESAVKAIGEALATATGTIMPAYASGGYHYGGLRLVGENGPELEATGPARYYSAQQTAAMMGGGAGVEAQIVALREENAAQARSIAALQARIVRLLETWDGSGLPEERVI